MEAYLKQQMARGGLILPNILRLVCEEEFPDSVHQFDQQILDVIVWKQRQEQKWMSFDTYERLLMIRKELLASNIEFLPEFSCCSNCAQDELKFVLTDQTQAVFFVTEEQMVCLADTCRCQVECHLHMANSIDDIESAFRAACASQKFHVYREDCHFWLQVPQYMRKIQFVA